MKVTLKKKPRDIVRALSGRNLTRVCDIGRFLMPRWNISQKQTRAQGTIAKSNPRNISSTSGGMEGLLMLKRTLLATTSSS